MPADVQCCHDVTHVGLQPPRRGRAATAAAAAAAAAAVARAAAAVVVAAGAPLGVVRGCFAQQPPGSYVHDCWGAVCRAINGWCCGLGSGCVAGVNVGCRACGASCCNMLCSRPTDAALLCTLSGTLSSMSSAGVGCMRSLPLLVVALLLPLLAGMCCVYVVWLIWLYMLAVLLIM